MTRIHAFSVIHEFSRKIQLLWLNMSMNLTVLRFVSVSFVCFNEDYYYNKFYIYIYIFFLKVLENWKKYEQWYSTRYTKIERIKEKLRK